MLAVVAAAGRGTRFLPSTKVMPKELLPLFDRPVLQHLIEEVDAAGLREIVVVTRPGTDRALRGYFARDPEWDAYLAGVGKAHLLQGLYELLDRVDLSFAVQGPDLPYGTGAPILAVRDRLAEPFVYLYGDDVIQDRQPGDTLRSLLDLYAAEQPAAVVAAVQVPHEAIRHVGSIAYLPGTIEVDRIVEKPEPDQAPSDVTPIGRMVLPPGIVAVLDELRDDLAPGRELWMTDGLTRLGRSGPVLAPRIPGQWLTTGDPLNLLRAAMALSGTVP